MTLDPECAACGKDYDLQVFDHIPSNNPIVLCLSCAAHEMSRNKEARAQYQFRGAYLTIMARASNDLLEEYLNANPHAREMAESMLAEPTTAYGALALQHVEEANRMEFATTMEKWVVANPDNILDAYIDSHPEKYPDAAPVVAQTDNAIGEAVWAEMRETYLGG